MWTMTASRPLLDSLCMHAVTQKTSRFYVNSRHSQPADMVPSPQLVFLAAANVAVLAAAVRRLWSTRKSKQQLAQSTATYTACTNGQDLKRSSPIRHIAPLHPEWELGMKQPMPFESQAFVGLDPAVTDKAAVYAFCISAVTPRPVAFISTMSKEGAVNLAPYSFFNIMGHNPPIVAIGMNRSAVRRGGKKDSLLNVESTKEMVVHLISEWCLESAHHTCADVPTGVDEMALVDMTPIPSIKVKPPRIKECAVAMECKLRHIQEYEASDGQPTVAVVLAEVVQFHIAEGVVGHSPSGKLVVDPYKLKPVSRLGGYTYGLVHEFVDMPKPGPDGLYTHGRRGPFVGLKQHAGDDPMGWGLLG